MTSEKADHLRRLISKLSRQMIQNQALLDQAEASFRAKTGGESFTIDSICHYLLGLDGEQGSEEQFAERLRALSNNLGESSFTLFVRALVSYRTIVSLNAEAQKALDLLNQESV